MFERTLSGSIRQALADRIRGANDLVVGINRQLGHFESNAIVAKTLDTGVHLAAGYAFDNDERQVGYLQLTVYF